MADTPFYQQSEDDQLIPQKALGIWQRIPPSFLLGLKNYLALDPPAYIVNQLGNGSTGGPAISIPPGISGGDTVTFNPDTGTMTPTSPAEILVAGGGNVVIITLAFEGNVDNYILPPSDETWTVEAITGPDGSGAGTATFTYTVNGGSPVSGLPTTTTVFNPGDYVVITAASNSGTVAVVTIELTVS